MIPNFTNHRVKAYVPTIVDGIRFMSKLEARWYSWLQDQRRAGLISDLEVHPRYDLQPKFEKEGRKERAITYTADFLITYPDGLIEVVDVKGFSTPEFIRTKKMFDYVYPALHLSVVKGVPSWAKLTDARKGAIKVVGGKRR